MRQGEKERKWKRIRERERERDTPGTYGGAPARGQTSLTTISGARPSDRVQAGDEKDGNQSGE